MIDLGYMDLEPYLSDIGDSGSDSCSSEIRNILTDFDSDYVSLGEDNSVMPMLYTHNSNNKMPIKSESVNSNFNTDDFPTNLEDIDWGLIEMEDAASPVLPSQQPPVTQELMVPVIEVTKVPLEDTHVPQCQSPTTTNSDKDDEESEDDDDNNNSRLTLPPRKSRQRSGGSTTSSSSSLDSESDREWRPEEEEVQQERPRLSPSRRRRRGAGGRRPGAGGRRDSVRKPKSHRPTPQRRAPGTSQKITQWIVSLLRDPRHNPSVITWHCERDGVFVIRDTERYARLWGEVKHNTKMTYEKLSRAMRYSYRNDELEMVPEQRLTYRFGASMADWRALDSDDPNFERRHGSSSSELDR